MTGRVATYSIGGTLEGDDIAKSLAAIKGQFKSAFAEIQSLSNKLELFGQLQQTIPGIQRNIDNIKSRITDLRAETEKLNAAGETVGADLTKALAAEETALRRATAEMAKQSTQAAELGTALRAAGVDTNNLSAAEAKLAAQSKTASAALAEQAAKQLLGVKTLADIQPQIAKLNAAYETLRTSGKLSTTELAAAQVALNAAIKETNASVGKVSTGINGLATGALNFKSTISTAFTASLGPILALVTAIGAIVSVFNDVRGAAKEFKSGIAEIGVATDLTKDQLAQLGEGARLLARTIGFDLKEGLDSLFAIIKSGIPADNALEVLKASAEAAKAGLSDLTTTTKISTELINGFGLQVQDLPKAFGALIQGAHDGGASFEAFAAAAGPLGNVARSAKIQFDDLIAVLTVMTRASGDAGESASALAKIIIKLGDPAVVDKLRVLGITSTNLVDIFKQLGAQGVPLQQIIDLGIASTKTAAAIPALTNNTKKLGEEQIKSAASGDVFQKSLEKSAQTAKDIGERFAAAAHDAAVSLGQQFGSTSTLARGATVVLNLFNDLAIAQRLLDQENVDGKISLTAYFDILLHMPERIQAAKDATLAHAAALKKQGDASDATTQQLDENTAKVTAFTAKIIENNAALQAAAARDISDLDARANEQIAALDKSINAQAATATATIAIQTKLAADRLAIIRRNEKDITDATNIAIAARFAAISDDAKKRDDFAAKNGAAEAKIRLDALAPVLAQYQDQYNKLIAQEQSYVAKINSIEQDRIAFNQGVQKQLFAISLEGLSGIDQYAAKVQEVDRLISASRAAAVKGDIAGAKSFIQEATALSNSLTSVVNKDGITIVSAFEAQQTRLADAKKEAEAYNFALDQEDRLAKEGAAATKKGLDEVIPTLTEVQGRYDKLTKAVADGLRFTAVVDEASAQKAEDVLTKLARDRTATITVQYVDTTGDIVAAPGTSSGSTGSFGDGATGEFAKGGFVGAIQRYARGGSVFRPPAWNKVPGVGNGDTVPALLAHGSFVLRKAASTKIGDTVLSRLARGYADGGGVLAGNPRFGIRRENTLSPGQTANYWKDYADTLDKLRTLAEAGRGLPAPPPGDTSIDKWAAGLVEGFPFFSKTHDDQIKKLLDDSYDGWLAGIIDAKKGGRASVMSYSLLALLKRYAGGGSVGTDTVPAMLTPGEYVFRPSAVQAISRAFGSDFLPAMNAMKVPANFFDFAPPPMPRIARFADGGPVGSVPSVSSAQGSFKAGGNTYEMHFHGPFAGSPDEFFRTFVAPALDKANRLSR